MICWSINKSCQKLIDVYIKEVKFAGYLLLNMCLSAVFLFNTGCSGINTGASVSPATFLLPGLIKNETPNTNIISNTKINAYLKSDNIVM